MKRTLIGILLLALTCITRAQAPAAPAHLPSFDVADIHRSPWVPPGTIYPDGAAWRSLLSLSQVAGKRLTYASLTGTGSATSH